MTHAGADGGRRRERRPADPARYYAQYPLKHPAHAVVRIAGAAVRSAAARHFSGRLLDIGCGTKAKALLIGDHVDVYVGLDHEGTLHDPANVDLFGSAYDIPADDTAFDCVLSTAVLEHLEEPLAALREAYRVLRPGGVALYTAPLFWPVHEAPCDFFRYTEFGLRDLFGRAGFDLMEVTPLSGFWTMVGAQVATYLQPFRRWPFRYAIDGLVAAGNIALPRLDRGRLRDERFTWMYMVVARRPVTDPARARGVAQAGDSDGAGPTRSHDEACR